MTITFRVDDGLDALAIRPALITVDQLASLRELLSSESARRALDLTLGTTLATVRTNHSSASCL